MPDLDLLREAQDPTTPAARLAEIAAVAPELGAEIAAHPASYPELLDWIASYGDDRARAAVAVRRASAAAPAPVGAPVGAPAATAPAAPYAPAPVGGAMGSAATAPAPAAAGLPPASGAKRLRRAPLIIAASVVGALVIGGGIAGAVILPRVLPATSPDGAVDKLVHAAMGFDALGLAGSLAPSEIASLTRPLERLRDIEVDADDQRTAQQALDRLTAAITTTADGLEYETDEIADGVQRVSIVDGTLEIDGDEDEIAEAYVDLARVYIAQQYEAMGLDDDDIDDALENARDGIADSLDLPYEIDFADVEDDLGFPISFVTVHEGAGWYVSPLMTSADYLYQSAAQSGYLEPGDLGDEIPAPVVAPDAAAAAEQTLTAALDTDTGRDYWENLAATLPIAERRLLAIYGPALGDDPWEAWNDADRELDLESADFELVDASHAVPDDVTISWEDASGDASGELSFDHDCVAWEFTSRYYDYYWEEYETSSSDGDGCIDDLPIDLEELGLGEPSLLATQADGGWQLSILGTLGEWASIATDNLVRLSKDGELDSLVEARG